VNDYDLSPYEEVLAKDSPGSEYKSVYLKCAEARGGPVKFRMKLKELKAKDALLSASAPATMASGYGRGSGSGDERESFSVGCRSVEDDSASAYRRAGTDSAYISKCMHTYIHTYYEVNVHHLVA
jgi:hypothetical protein